MVRQRLEDLRPYLARVGTRGAFARNVSITLLAQVLVLFTILTNAAIIARWLGPGGKGMLSLALLVPGIVALFLSGGIAVANVYFAGSRRLSLDQLAANSTALGLIGSVLGVVVVGLLAKSGWLNWLVPDVPAALIGLAMISLPVLLLNTYFSALMQGTQQIPALNVVNVGQGILTLALTLLLVVGLGWGISGAVLAVFGAGLGGLVAMTWILRRAGAHFRPRLDRVVLHQTYGYGLRGYVGNVLQFFNYRLDVLLVNGFLGPAAVGIYGAAVGLAELLWYLPNAVGFVIFPKASATRAEEMNRFTPRVFGLTLGLTAVGAVVLALLGPLLIRIVFGPAFSASYAPLLALLPGIVLLGGGKVLTSELAGRGYAHYNSINAGMALVLTVVLDLVLIPRLGVTGAAIASTVAYSVIFVTAVFFYLVVSRRSRTAAGDRAEGSPEQGDLA